jgi:copper(I)-binding protein
MSPQKFRSVLRRRAAVTAPAAGVALLLALTGCGGTSSAGETSVPSTTASTVEVSDAWVRATQGTEDPSMTGAFMVIDNEGEENVSLTGASSPVAASAELHEMASVDGSMVMREVDGGIEIEAGYGQVLMPGGYHVMLMGLTDELAPGDEVELVLEFSDGSSEELTVPVKEFTEEEGHYHEPGTPDSHSHSGDASMAPSGSAKP